MNPATALIIINDGPYATERAFNGLRLANALLKEPFGARVRIFFLSDGVTCALPNQLRPDGSYNVESLLTAALRLGAEAKVCGNCTDQRGLFGLALVEGVQVGSMPELSEWVLEADRVVTF